VSGLIQLIYSSTATHALARGEIEALLSQSREKNARLGITGMLLYIDRSFFQVLEGEEEIIDALFSTISGDRRHTKVTTIIREAVKERAFPDWSMGYADISAGDADAIVGENDFFRKGESLDRLTQGRAKKLLLAFKEGRWRAHLGPARVAETFAPVSSFPAANVSSRPAPSDECECTFAFQPIVNVSANDVFSYEALIRGRHNESAEEVLSRVYGSEVHFFDLQCHSQAIRLAAALGLRAHLNINMFPGDIERVPTAIDTVLRTAQGSGLRPEQIIIEILEHDFIADPEQFAKIINRYRSSGLQFAIDDFGSGYAGLNLLADFQPDFIKLDIHLVRNIDRQGPRQAIVRGIIRTCFDLGIDIIAEGVEKAEEYEWLRGEGISLFQGFFFAAPAFEALPRPEEIFPG